MDWRYSDQALAEVVEYAINNTKKKKIRYNLATMDSIKQNRNSNSFFNFQVKIDIEFNKDPYFVLIYIRYPIPQKLVSYSPSYNSRRNTINEKGIIEELQNTLNSYSFQSQYQTNPPWIFFMPENREDDLMLLQINEQIFKKYYIPGIKFYTHFEDMSKITNSKFLDGLTFFGLSEADIIKAKIKMKLPINPNEMSIKTMLDLL